MTHSIFYLYVTPWEASARVYLKLSKMGTLILRYIHVYVEKIQKREVFGILVIILQLY